MVKSPVLFQTFARPDYARQVWDAIKASKPSKLYFYSNKARADRPEEIKNNEAVRSLVKEVDWECELHTWFREEYVDVYTSLKGSVDWVCEHEEEWIVLEEDVVPTPAFFSFCDQMLDFYRNNMRVWNVSGDNFWDLSPQGYDYLFSSYHWMYGWATWRSRWIAVDFDNVRLNEMFEQDIYRYMYKSKAQYKSRIEGRKHQRDFIESTKCWDYMFGMACEQNGAVEVVPAHHLITNIGVSGMHHKVAKTSFVNIKSNYLDTEYRINRRPPFVYADYEYDYQIYYREEKELRPLWKRIIISIADFIHVRDLFRRK